MSEVTFTHQEAWRQRFRDSLPPWPACVLIALFATLVPVLLLRFPMVWVIGAVVGFLGLVVTVAFPFVGMLVFLGLLYLRPEESFPALAGARMTLIVSMTAFSAWAINACLIRERFRFEMPVVTCFLGFLAVAIGSTALSGSGALAETALELIKLLILFLLIIHLVNSQLRLRIMTGTLVLFTAAVGARTIWQYGQGQAMFTSEGAVRALATGIFGDPNDLALAMAMALPLTFGAIFGGASAWTRTWSLAAVPVLIWTIYITNSRGGMVALGVAVLGYFGRRLGRTGLLVGTAAVLGLFAFGPSRLSQMNADEPSAQGRVYAWQAGMEMLNRSPIWGVGKEQFLEHHRRTAHNSLVLCLAETGFAGTVFWLGLFYFAFRDTHRSARGNAQREQQTTSSPPKALRWNIASQSLAVQISLVTFIVGSFFLSRTYTPPLYVYLGLAVAAAQVEGSLSGAETSGASGRDWLWIVALALGGWILIHLLVRLWS